MLTQSDIDELAALQSGNVLNAEVLRLTPKGAQILLPAPDREILDVIVLDLEGVRLTNAAQWAESRFTQFHGDKEGLEPSIVAVGGEFPTSEELAAAASAGIVHYDSTTESLGRQLAKTFGFMNAVAMQTGSAATASASQSLGGVPSAVGSPQDLAAYAAAPFKLTDADFEQLVRRTQTDAVDRED